MVALSQESRPLWMRAGSFATQALSTRLLAVMSAAYVFVLSQRYARAYYYNVVDDALTSFQYAKNLARGDGVVFNIGERVEGYTNFLWVVVMAPVYALARAVDADPVRALVLLNCGLAALNVLLAYRLCKQLWGDDWLATSVALILPITDNSYTVWAALGLEGHLLGTCLLASLLFAGSNLAHRGAYLGLSLTAAHMTRPDAGLFMAILFAALGLTWLVSAHRQQRALGSGWTWRALFSDLGLRSQTRVLLEALAVYVFVYGSYFAWRYGYYGWLFPNTYYLKVGSGELNAVSRGLAYLGSFFWERHWIPLFAVLGLFARTSALGRALIVYLAAHTLYIMYVGGDFFPGHRFFVPQLPLVAVGIGLGVHALTGLLGRLPAVQRLAKRPRLVPAAGALALLTLAPLFWSLYDRGRTFGPLKGEILDWREDIRTRRDLMSWLAINKTSNASLATGGIGAAGFYGDFRVIDMVGILDPVVAHRPVANFGKGQAGHEKWATLPEILAKKPDYIEFGYLRESFWENGYYLDSSMRGDLANRREGVWRRDELAETGTYTLLFGFHPGQQGFDASGSAFVSWPSVGAPPNGATGGYIDTSRVPLRDGATGVLRSLPFELTGELMVLRVGGGFDPKALSVSLSIDERVVFSETGHDTNSLSQRRWPIAPYRGKMATLEIRDDSPAGHLIVDEVAQWQRR